MEELLDILETYVPNFEELIGLIGFGMLIFGLADAFLGYRLFNVVLAIIGFMVGAGLGLIIFLGSEAGSSDAAAAYIWIGGFIGSTLAEIFHKMGVFLVAWAAGAIITFGMTQNTDVCVAAGIICGIAGIILERYVIVISTAFSGGSLTAMGIWFIGLSNGENRDVWAIGGVIGICGMLCQLFLTRDKIRNGNSEARTAGTARAALDLVLGCVCFIAEVLQHLYNFVRRPQKRQCPKCKAAVAVDSLFCGTCGFSLQGQSAEAAILCANCGTRMPDGSRFCGKCGARLN